MDDHPIKDENLTLEHQLESLFEDESFAELGRAFERFCPFEAMGMVRAEIRHSNFLRNMLDPSYGHGFGPEILGIFLEEMARRARWSDGPTPLEASLLDLSGATVRREWKNIDLLIELPAPKIVLAIEIKIDASQSLDQLSNYRCLVEADERYRGWRQRYVFLTKEEETPQDEQWNHMDLSLLETVGRRVKGQGQPFAAQMFEAYLAMLRRHHMGDDRLEELAKGLWAKHREALTYLSEREPNSLADVMELISASRDQIARTASEPLKIVSDSATPSIVRFAVEKWDQLPNFRTGIPGWSNQQRIILLEIKRERERVAAALYLGPGRDANIREAYANLLASARFHRTRAKMTPTYSCLAKEVLFDTKGNDEFDKESAKNEVVKGFVSFVRKFIPHFDTELQKLRS